MTKELNPPKFIEELSEFEKFRYNKLSIDFCAHYRKSKKDAQDFVDNLNLKREEYKYFRYYNNLRLSGKIK